MIGVHRAQTELLCTTLTLSTLDTVAAGKSQIRKQAQKLTDAQSGKACKLRSSQAKEIDKLRNLQADKSHSEKEFNLIENNFMVSIHW